MTETHRAFSGRSLLLAVVLAAATPAFATDYTWNAAGGGDFGAAANWTPAGGPPVVGDVAIFDNEATGTITLAADRSVNQLSFRNDSGALTFNLGGFNLSLNVANGFQFGTAAAQANDVTITNGTITAHTSGNGILWSTANIQNNKLTLTGANTLLTGISTSSSLIGTGAGAAGNVFSVENGATVSMNNNFLLGVISTTATTNAINVTDANFHITNANRGFALQSGTLNITRSNVSTGYLGAATDAQVPTYSGSVNFNSGTLGARFVRMIGGQTFYIGDGGPDDADFRMINSGPTVNAPGGVHVRSNGSIGGAGTITGNVAGDAGARFLSETLPTGAAITTINGNFDASNFEIILSLGDFPTELANDLAVPQAFNPPHQQILVNGLFTHADAVTIDLTGYVAPEDQDYELKLIGWSSESGTPGAVSFVGGGPLDYEYRSDGLYLIAAVPEPASLALLAIGGAVMARRRRLN